MWSAEHDGSDPTTVTESGKIVAAFGRNGGSAASRQAARRIVEETQNSKRWFFCGCRDNAVLVPVEGTHVRRKIRNSADHDDDCPFSVEPKDQALIVKSMRSHAADVPFSFLVERADGAQETSTGTFKQSHSKRRPGLARLLISLAEASTIQRVGRSVLGIGEQFGSLKDQAGKFLLAPNLPVRRMLCSDTRKYDDFVSDFDEKAQAARFPNRVRPHGILLDKIKGVSNGQLICMDGKALPVVGSISIFGRADAPVKDWSTYIVAGLIGRLSGDLEPRLLRAYVHPCVSSRNLMLVDSNYERGTLKIIRKLQKEFQGIIDFSVRKPLTDVGVRQIADDISDDDARGEIDRDGAPRILIPDFILEFPQFARKRGDIIVETLGFSWTSYRDDKKVTIPAMQAALGGIAAVAHDFCFPEELDKEQRHARFEARLKAMVQRRAESFQTR
ncbi:UNVERIFIED_ORG: hypothetical protein J2W85_002379 [Ensifer adhaerens]|nr:hypothetical protein [Ensifer adhaerens]